ncbi:sugar phosphate isomerase/epimerase [Pontiellaceae bacterium B1224]|nr:sugar phosphate isomerase/epimerase [Pontiellaceae bacterium B1224]
MNRKGFIQTVAAASAVSSLDVFAVGRPRFDISLAQWSVRNLIWGKEPGAEKLDPLDFAAYAKNTCGIGGLEYVNSFYFGKEGDEAYFNELKKRADRVGATSVLIMCDRCGTVGDPNEAKRNETVQKHLPWMQAARQLGCHSIRVNAGSSGSFEEQQKLAADGLTKLADAAKPYGLNVIVENHGGLSSNGEWLSGVMKMVNLPTVGTLPDFGNFTINRATGASYDRYKGIAELMPFAKGISAKSHAFDAEGNETQKDYFRIMKIVADSGYKGYVGVEWEGGTPGTTEGILLTKALIERAVAAL